MNRQTLSTIGPSSRSADFGGSGPPMLLLRGLAGYAGELVHRWSTEARAAIERGAAGALNRAIAWRAAPPTRPSREIVWEIVVSVRHPCYPENRYVAGLFGMPEEGLEPPTRGL